jgi:hypothetical protein
LSAFLIFLSFTQENLSDFVLSLDAWTSNNGYAFMAIIIHYIGNDGKLGTPFFESTSTQELS